MSTKTYSIIREQEYLRIEKLVLNGSILDIGGSTKSGYHKLIKGEHHITTANIDSEYGCDLVFDIQNPFPVKNNEFNHVVVLNVLEHIYRFHNVFSEAFRVLKNGGSFIFATPFFHQIHGSPDDYFRYTKSTLEKILKENNFNNIVIEELGFGLFSLFFQIIGGGLPPFLRNITKRLCIGTDKSLLKVSRRYRNLNKKIPLGYFVIAKK